MKKIIRKISALLLAFAMLMSACFVFSFAADDYSDETLSFKTEFYKQNDSGEWVVTNSVEPGDTVKARLSIGTTYYTTGANIIVFYDEAFFTDSYTKNSMTDSVLNTSSTSSAATENVMAYTTRIADTHRIIAGSDSGAGLVEYGYITQDFVDAHEAFIVTVMFSDSGAHLLSDSEWLVEFDLEVRSDASGIGTFTVVENTVQRTGDRENAYINVPVSYEGGFAYDSIPLYNAAVNVDITDGYVTTYPTLTLNANGGSFTDGVETFAFSAEPGSPIESASVPTPEFEGYLFEGWALNGEGEPSHLPALFPETDAEYFAIWSKIVEIIINNGSSSENLTFKPGEPLIIDDPVAQDGYEFVGWTTDPTLQTVTGLPDVCPDESVTFYPVFKEIETTTTQPETTEPQTEITTETTTENSTTTAQPETTETTKSETTTAQSQETTAATKPSTTALSTTTPDVTKPETTVPHTTEPSTTKPNVTEPSTVPSVVYGITIKNPSRTSINYGDGIVLHASLTKPLPDDYSIVWEADNSNFTMTVSADALTCTILPELSGDTVFTAKIVDENGEEVSSDTQQMTSKAGFFQKLIAFFKKLFGLTKIYPNFNF